MDISSEEEFQLYLAFHSFQEGKKPNIDLMQECSAYAYEIEALNLLLSGALKAFVEGKVKLDVDSVSALLNARKDQRETVELLIVIAANYYPEGIDANGNLNRRFVDFMARTLSLVGQNVFVQDRSGYHRYQPRED